MIGIYIFRRDLRIYDNKAFISLSNKVNIIIPIFILDPLQINQTSKNKHYISNNVIQFMCESLIDLNNQLNNYLNLFYGNPSKCLEEIIQSLQIKYKDTDITIAFNKDFSEYSLKRDQELIDIASKYSLNIITDSNDLSLIDLSKLNPYKQYGAFYKKTSIIAIDKPQNPKKITFMKHTTTLSYPITDLNKFYKINNNLAQNGGRTQSLNRLNLLHSFKEYDKKRDILSYNTTNLSAYLNFGCLSIREVYYYMKNLHLYGLIKQLYWRDFFLQILIKISNAISFNSYIDEKYNKLKWKNDPNDWKRLIDSQTGFLVVDAAMNEMKITGFMHNRARMIVGFFWTKYLLIDNYHPIYGSQVGFSKYLVDAVGCSQNKLNHAWITELDYSGRRYAPKGIPLAGRPMNISNSIIKKFDPSCEYIKKWLPHMEQIPTKQIFKWDEDYDETIHPGPMFNSKEKYKEWIKLCSH